MCGRFAVTTDPALLAERIDAINEVPPDADTGPNYNVAPTDAIVTVVSRHSAPPKPGGSARLDEGEVKLEPPQKPGDEPTRRVRLMRWGLVPPWTKAGPDGAPAAGGPLMINARADKLTTSPAYRSAAAHRRCLVPMDGFYEWRPGGSARLDGGEAKLGPSHEPDGTQSGRRARKTPFYIHGDGAMLFAAGLWSVWRGDSQSGPLLSVTIVTTGAVGELAEIHDRMPLLLPENCWDAWLDPDAPADPALLAHPPAAPAVVLREVSTLVNSVRNNGPELIAAVAPQPEQPYLL